MTGMMMPEYWAEAELTRGQGRPTLVQWLLRPRGSSQRDQVIGGAAPVEKNVPELRRADYLANIW